MIPNGVQIHHTRRLPDFLLSLNLKYVKLGYHYLITHLFTLTLIPIITIQASQVDIHTLCLHLKYRLIHVVRTHKGADDKAFKCVYQEHDDAGKTGVSLSKDLMAIAGGALKTNITTLGPLVLPISEQLLFFSTLITKKLFNFRVWQIAFGSGFKCNSAVWQALRHVKPSPKSPWGDCIDNYPVQILA